MFLIRGHAAGGVNRKLLALVNGAITAIPVVDIAGVKELSRGSSHACGQGKEEHR